MGLKEAKRITEDLTKCCCSLFTFFVIGIDFDLCCEQIKLYGLYIQQG